MTEPIPQPDADFPEAKPGASAPGLHPYWSRVGFWWRVLAWLLDVVFMLIPAIGTGIVLYIAIEAAAGISPPDWVIELIVGLVVLIYTLMEVFFRGTPGKLILRMRIMAIDGTPADKWQLILRWSTKQSPLLASILFDVTQYSPFKVLSGLSGFIIFIGCLFVANDDKLAWHDQWAMTAVYPLPKRQPQGFEVMQPGNAVTSPSSPSPESEHSAAPPPPAER